MGRPDRGESKGRSRERMQELPRATQSRQAMTMKRKTGPAVIKGPPGETPLEPNLGDSRSEYWRYSANLNEDILQQSKTQHKQTRMVCAIVSEMCGARGRTGCPSECRKEAFLEAIQSGGRSKPVEFGIIDYSLNHRSLYFVIIFARSNPKPMDLCDLKCNPKLGHRSQGQIPQLQTCTSRE